MVAPATAGLRRMTRLLSHAGVGEIAIERGDEPIVDALLEAGFVVFVIAPGQVKNLRQRYGAAGNKDDHFNAYVLADTLRTDRHRLHPLTHVDLQKVATQPGPGEDVPVDGPSVTP